MEKKKGGRKVKTELVIDGKKVPMNDFIRKIFTNTVGAMVECLHGIDENWTEISLKIEKDGEEEKS
jgi:hypothetical protein